MAPGPVLAGLVAKVTGTDGAALAAWGELVTLAEFTRRRPGALAGSAAARVAAEEAAWKTNEAWTRMLDQAALGATAAARLPQTLAALGQAAGIEGTVGQLQVQAMMDFLLGRAAPGARQGAHPGRDRGARLGAHPGLDEDVRESACQDTHADVDDDEGAWQDAHERNGRGGGRAGWAVNPGPAHPVGPGPGLPGRSG